MGWLAGLAMKFERSYPYKVRPGTRKFQCVFYFISKKELSLGVNVGLDGPNLQIFVPFGFFSIGWTGEKILIPMKKITVAQLKEALEQFPPDSDLIAYSDRICIGIGVVRKEDSRLLGVLHACPDGTNCGTCLSGKIVQNFTLSDE
jgi:hypothetical protein